MRTAPVLAALAALTASDAHAAAYYFSDAGTRALGRGAAFVAGADDLSAQYYNPGALIRLRQTQVMVNVSGVSQYVMFDRADESGLDPFEAVYNEAAPMVIPTLGVSTTFGLPNTTFALGFYPPYAPDMLYPEDGPQRYALVDSLVWQTFTGLSAAQRITPWLSVGAGVSWTLMRAEQELVVAMCAKGAECGDNPAQDVSIRLEAWEKFRIMGNAGVLVEPTHWLAIGASFVPPITFHAKGSISTDFGDDHSLGSFLEGTEFSDDDIVLTVPMPMVARLGVQVKPIEALEIELASVYEGWSVAKELRVSDVNLVITTNKDNPLAPDEDIAINDDVVLPTGYVDAVSVRLGGEYTINDRFTARAGGLYETSGVPAATQGVALVDGPKFGYGVGGTARLVGGLHLDLAFAQSYLASREITDSEVKLVQMEFDIADPASSGIVEGKTVGNGTFASHLTFMSAGVTWVFGKGAQG